MHPQPPALRALSPRTIGLAGLLIVVTAAGLVARNVVSGQQAAPAASAVAAPRAPAAVVQTAPVTRGAIRSTFSYAGNVQASQQVNVVPRTAGLVKTIEVDVGSVVQQGEV